MLKYGNRDFRNLQEQVYANMQNIQDIIDGSNIMADFKVINVVGTADSAEELPDPDTYTGSYGDAILVGTAEPYHYYLFCKAYENENAPQWFDIGVFPKPGPQGPKGDKGDPGSVITGPQEILDFMEGSNEVSVALNAAQTKVKIDLVQAVKDKIQNVDSGTSDAEDPYVVMSWSGTEATGAHVVYDGGNDEIVINGGENGKLLLANGYGPDLGNEDSYVYLTPEEARIVGSDITLEGDVGITGGLSLGEDIPDVATAISELQGKADNSLQLPEEAPASQELVGVNTSGEQNALTLGSGLIVDSGALNTKRVTLDFNSTNRVVVSQELFEALEGHDYVIYVKNPKVGTSLFSGIFPFYYIDRNRGYALVSTRYQLVEENGYQVLRNEEGWYLSLIHPPGGAYSVSISNDSNSMYIGRSFDFDFNPATQAGSGSVSSTYVALLKRCGRNMVICSINISGRNYSTDPMPEVYWVGATNTGSNGYLEGYARDIDKTTGALKALYKVVVTLPNSGNGAYTVTNILNTKEFVLASAATIYESSLKQTAIASLDVYQDAATRDTYVKLGSANLSLDVLDTASASITVANKSIADYIDGGSGTIYLRVANDGTDWYLAGGLYKAITLTLGFTKPATAVGAIVLKCKITNGGTDRYLSPSILFGGTSAIDAIPTQYNGINRNSITTVGPDAAILFKVAGSQITFGADDSVNLSFCYDTDIVKSISIS